MGLTFLNGLFALALSAVALPILIHLLNRRRSRREKFSSLEFLEEVSRRQRRRIQVRQWLLLVLRILIVALVVLAMMRPALKSSGPGGIGSTTAAIILDSSFSMLAGTEAGSARETAARRLEEIESLFGAGDRAQLIWPNPVPRTAFDGPVEDFGRIRAASAAALTSFAPAAPIPALQSAIESLDRASGLNREIYVISDFQEADWPPDGDYPEFPDWARVYLVPVTKGPLPNVAIANATHVKATIESGSSGAVRVMVANHSDEPLSSYPIEVFADDQVVASGTVSVPVGEIATTDLSLTQAVPAGKALQVRVPEDVLSADDVAWVTPGERHTVRVLLVQGGATEELRGEPYLRLALDPPGQVGERLFTVQEVPLQDLPVLADLDYDVFVLNNVGRLSQGAIERLRLAREDGAGVLFILGDRVDLAYYNNHVMGEFIDASLEEPASANGSFFTLRPLVPGHPIFDGFKIESDQDLTSARFRTVVRGRAGPRARVLAAFGAHPALIEGDRVLLFTSSMDLRWGNFPTGGSFLPFVHQIVLNLSSSAVESRQFKAGGPITIDFPLEKITGDVVVFAPDGSELAVEQEVRAGRVEIRTEPAPTPGVYRFTSAGQTLREVAVHLDVSESRLHYRDPGQVAKLLGERARVLEPDDALAARVNEDRKGREIWRELILAALALMVVETIVGRMRFG